MKLVFLMLPQNSRAFKLMFFFFYLDWEGDDCNVLLDNCADVVCPNRGECVDGYDSYHCEDAPTSMYARAFKDMGSCGRGDG